MYPNTGKSFTYFNRESETKKNQFHVRSEIVSDSRYRPVLKILNFLVFIHFLYIVQLHVCMYLRTDEIDMTCPVFIQLPFDDNIKNSTFLAGSFAP